MRACVCVRKTETPFIMKKREQKRERPFIMREKEREGERGKEREGEREGDAFLFK